jgi:excisionase family DNA binding protein
VTDAQEWVSVGEASRLLGVDPDTLRRWSDAGQVEVFTTPGGHRRFLRSSLESMMPRPPWLARLDDASVAWFRQRGRRMSELLLATLDGTRSRERAIIASELADLSREYGARSAKDGVSIGEATQAFLFFRARFLAEVTQLARRGKLDARATAALVAEADGGLDDVIVGLVAGHRATSPRSRR